MNQHIYSQPWWQNSAQLQLGMAQAALAGGRDGLPSRCYLEDRGLTWSTVEAFGLGCAYYYNPGLKIAQDAIVIPWLSQHGLIEALRYRFIMAPKAARYHQKAGSINTLFGCYNLRWPVGVDTLFLVEGEFNAMSLWQVLGDRADVLSFGPMDALCNPWVAATANGLARIYARVYVWTDSRESAVQAGSLLDQAEFVYHLDSETAGGDANDLLVAGNLAAYLAQNAPSTYHNV